MTGYAIRPLTEKDRSFVRQFMEAHWGGEEIIVHNEVFHPAELPGFMAIYKGETVGLVTYAITGDSCEIVTLDSLLPGKGIGTVLISGMEETALAAGCKEVCLVTTNDNMQALGFYQKRGFRIAAVAPGAVDESRKRKPAIPLIGENGIPIHDEIILTRLINR